MTKRIVTGGELRDALRQWELRKEAVALQFADSIHAFPGEDKDPVGLMTRMMECENAISLLQVAQLRYNLAVTVQAGRGANVKTMTLAEAVKRVGGAGRAEGLWKAATKIEQDPYVRRSRVTTEVSSVRTITVDDAVKQAVAATSYAESLRAAINFGNTKEVEIEDLDPSLFQ